jgi:hypothetical protein
LNSCKIQFDVMLSSSASAVYRVCIGIQLRRVDSDNIVWEQLDKADYRMPDRGRAEVSGADVVLYRMNGATKEAVARLLGFTIPPTGYKGGIDFDFIMPKGYPDQGSRWRGKGEWTLLHNDWVEGNVGFYGALTLIPTGWRVTSTGGGSVGIGPSWSFNGTAGSMLIENPSEARGKSHKLVFGGIGGGYGRSSEQGVGFSATYSSLSWPWSGGLGGIAFGTSAIEQPMPIDAFTGHVTILDVTAALVDKYFPTVVAKKIKMTKSPVGIGGALSVSCFFFGVPPAIGAIPLIYKAGTFVWGLSVAASNATASIGAAWYHGYAEIED